MKRIVFAFVFLFLGFGALVNAQKLNVASYNIRTYVKSDSVNGNGWHQRCPVICNLITYHEFDIFGAQEVTHRQLTDMLAALPEYAYIGVGRDDAKEGGEYSPIFYRKDKFKVLRSGTFWLSPTPNEVSMGWDAACRRVCSWGEFQDKATGLRFWLFNTHMDHVGVEARREGAKVILSKIKELANVKQPIIVMGDFNVDQHNESYTLLNTSGIVKDAYELAKIRYALNGTFNAFDPNLQTDQRIDHIFVSNAFTVNKYGILTDTYRSPANGDQQALARVPSDHFPVKIELIVKKKK